MPSHEYIAAGLSNPCDTRYTRISCRGATPLPDGADVFAEGAIRTQYSSLAVQANCHVSGVLWAKRTTSAREWRFHRDTFNGFVNGAKANKIRYIVRCIKKKKAMSYR